MAHRVPAAEVLPSIRPAAERALSLAFAPDEPVLWRAEPKRMAMLIPMIGVLPFVLAGGAFALIGHAATILCGTAFAVLACVMSIPTVRAVATSTYAITDRQVLAVHGGWRRTPAVIAIALPTLVKVSCVSRWFSTADLELYVTMTRDSDGIVVPDLVLRGLHRRDVARFIEHLPQGHRPEVPR